MKENSVMGKYPIASQKKIQSPHVLNPKPISMFSQTNTTPLSSDKTQNALSVAPPYNKLPIKRLTYAERQAKMRRVNVTIVRKSGIKGIYVRVRCHYYYLMGLFQKAVKK